MQPSALLHRQGAHSKALQQAAEQDVQAGQRMATHLTPWLWRISKPPRPPCSMAIKLPGANLSMSDGSVSPHVKPFIFSLKRPPPVAAASIDNMEHHVAMAGSRIAGYRYKIMQSWLDRDIMAAVAAAVKKGSGGATHKCPVLGHMYWHAPRVVLGLSRSSGLVGGEHKSRRAYPGHGLPVLRPACEGTSRLLG